MSTKAKPPAGDPPPDRVFDTYESLTAALPHNTKDEPEVPVVVEQFPTDIPESDSPAAAKSARSKES